MCAWQHAYQHLYICMCWCMSAMARFVGLLKCVCELSTWHSVRWVWWRLVCIFLSVYMCGEACSSPPVGERYKLEANIRYVACKILFTFIEHIFTTYSEMWVCHSSILPFMRACRFACSSGVGSAYQCFRCVYINSSVWLFEKQTPEHGRRLPITCKWIVTSPYTVDQRFLMHNGVAK